MILKKGVVIQGISNELMLGLIVADQVYAEHKTNMVITSLLDGKHSRTSLHYSGNGGDLRIRNLPIKLDKQIIVDEIKERLGIHYDVVLESNHIHMEYQPRKITPITY